MIKKCQLVGDKISIDMRRRSHFFHVLHWAYLFILDYRLPASNPHPAVS